MVFIIHAGEACAQYVTEGYIADKPRLTERKLNIVKTNLLYNLLGDLNIAYERLSSTSRRSLVVMAEYEHASTDEVDVSAALFRPGLRYYLTKKKQSPAGYYIQPVFTYGDYTVHDKVNNIGANVNLLGGGIVSGIQWAIGKRFTVEVYVDAEYGSYSISTNNARVKDALNAFQLSLGASTGFRF